MFQRISSIFDEYKGIPHEANLLIYSSFFTWAAAGLLFISLQVFLVLEGISFATSSLILGTFGIVSASSTLVFGGLADRYGKKKLVVIGGILGSLALAIFAVDSNISHLFGAAVLAGLSEAMYASSWSAMLADKAGNRKRTSAFGLSFFVATIASALGGFSTSLLDLLKSVEKEPRHSFSIRCLRDRNCSRRWHGNPPYPRLGLSQVRSSKRRHWANLWRHQQPCDGIRQPCNSPACPEVRNCSDNRANARNVYAVSFLDSILAQLRHCLLDLHRQEHANDDVEPRSELSFDGFGSSRRAICSFCHRGFSLEAAQLVQHRHRRLYHGSSNESQQHLPSHTVHDLHGTLPECDHVLLACIQRRQTTRGTGSGTNRRGCSCHNLTQHSGPPEQAPITILRLPSILRFRARSYDPL